MILKRARFILLSVSLLLTACGDNDQSAETQRFIQQVKENTKANAEPESIDLSGFSISPITDLHDIQKRNPFSEYTEVTLTETPGEGAGQQPLKMTLVGIFYINKKKWAIIRANDRIYRVVEGDNIGPNQRISKITDRAVTVIQDEKGEEKTFTLILQEQKK